MKLTNFSSGLLESTSLPSDLNLAVFESLKDLETEPEEI